MKTKLLSISFLAMLSMTSIFAQEKTTVTASSADISDHLDLRAIASIFGDASNLEDFENRINNPKTQISNLDLNNDSYVDYLRVIESVEVNVHLVIIQAVLDKDIYQDVATIEVQKDRNNNVQVQVVGDVYMYGENYIYEPVYVHTPVIYNTFWVTNYRPYYSSWYWNYYPSYYTYWNPFPIFRYRNHISVHINFGHSYHYVTNRRCASVYNNYYGRRGNGYETRHPNRSFAHRNSGYTNRYELDNNRGSNSRARTSSNSNSRTSTSSRASSRASSRESTMESSNSRPDSSSNSRTSTSSNSRPDSSSNSRADSRTSTRASSSSQRAETPRVNSVPRSESSSKVSTPRGDSGQRNSAPRENSGSRSSGSRNAGRG